MTETSVWIQATISGLSAGIFVSLTSWLIERFGGVIGGLLSTTPTTITLAAIGFSLQEPNVNLDDAFFIAPVGMCASLTFLFLFKTIPNTKCLKDAPFRTRLAITIAAASLVWLILAVLIVTMVKPLLIDEAGVPIQYVGLGAFMFMIVFGVSVLVFAPAPAPRASTKVSWKVYLLRATCATVILFCALMLGQLDAILAGMTVIFPVFFGTAMVSLSMAHGFEITSGVVGPMMLGTCSVAMFAMLYASTYPLLRADLDQPAAIAITLITSYLIAVCCGSVPIYFFVAWRKRVDARRAATTAVADDDDHAGLLNDDVNGGGELLVRDLSKRTDDVLAGVAIAVDVVGVAVNDAILS
jgi:hypothetical protein